MPRFIFARLARIVRRTAALAAVGLVMLTACQSSNTQTTSATAPAGGHPAKHGTISAKDRAAAQLAAAGFQDVATAEAAGYASTLDSLGCFENPALGGMGVHYLNEALMDATVDITKPEALVYELNAGGAITGLVAHEYIVPVDAWTAAKPPRLFGVGFHRHPTLPLWVLHAWLWKDNPTGVFMDWNPAVRLCPDGVPIFGADNSPTRSPVPHGL